MVSGKLTPFGDRWYARRDRSGTGAEEEWSARRGECEDRSEQSLLANSSSSIFAEGEADSSSKDSQKSQ